jgi:hypothetical protein
MCSRSFMTTQQLGRDDKIVIASGLVWCEPALAAAWLHGVTSLSMELRFVDAGEGPAHCL